MTVRLVTFDLDDTLWDVSNVMRKAEAALRQWLGMHAPRLGEPQIEYIQSIRQALLSQEPLLQYRLSELRRKILLTALLEAGYTANDAAQLSEQAFQVFFAARHQVELFPGVHQVLRQLSQHYQLAVITNGNADVTRIGLGQYFTFALNAEALGIGKPHPLPFSTALQRAGVSAEQAVHIGDHPEDDIAGAQGVGMRAIWFNRQQTPWAHAHQPHGQIHDLLQLPQLLQDWQQ